MYTIFIECLLPVEFETNLFVRADHNQYSTNEQQYTTVKNSSYNYSSFTTTLPTATDNECRRLCDNTYDCTGYSYNTLTDSLCNLTNVSTLTSQPTASHVYTYVTVQKPSVLKREYVFIPNTSYQLQTSVANVPVHTEDVSSCLDLCDRTYGCKGFNFTNGLCALATQSNIDKQILPVSSIDPHIGNYAYLPQYSPYYISS